VRKKRKVDPRLVEPCYQIIGERLRRYRLKKGMTQVEVADALGYIGRGAMANIETGRQRIMLHNVVAIAKYMGIKPARLLAGVFAKHKRKKQTIGRPPKNGRVAAH
jgi:transcriptional regulator with XRE-family HTH domain